VAITFNRRDFLDSLFGPFTIETRYFILVKTADEYGDRASNRFYPNIMELSNAEFPPNRNVYFGICPRERMQVGKEAIRYITALWAGLDMAPGGYSGPNSNYVDLNEAREAIKAFPLKPSIIVQSGRGFHLYWLLHTQKKIPDIEVVENLLRKLNDHFRCSAPVGIDSTLRLPGTWNPRGPKGPTKCLVEHLDSALRYYPTEFQNLDLRVITPPEVMSPKVLAEKQRSETAPALEISETVKKLGHEAQRPDTQDQPTQAKPNESFEPKFLRKIVETNNKQGGNQTSLKELAGKDLDDLADNIADKLVQRITENLSNGHLDRIIDRLVEKLTKRIHFPKGDA
jgi:hypothetical protein